MLDEKLVENLHIGRSWNGHTLEDACPCPQEKCGLVAYKNISQECTQHPFTASKTIRQTHTTEMCEAISI